MSFSNVTKLEKLQCTFPKLTDANQQFVLGIAFGLKYSQGKFEAASRVGKEDSVPWRKVKEP